MPKARAWRRAKRANMPHLLGSRLASGFATGLETGLATGLEMGLATGAALATGLGLETGAALAIGFALAIGDAAPALLSLVGVVVFPSKTLGPGPCAGYVFVLPQTL
jgi:hypothetical protein